jgi:hypothetical protein
MPPDKSEDPMTEPNPAMDADQLIERLRARAADPERRTDHRPSVFESRVGSMSLGELFSTGRSVFGDLMKVVKTNQAGLMPDPQTLGRAEQFERDMTTPATAPPLRQASEAGLRAAEEALGVTFPPLLVRAYVEVADGGFGPGGGLVSLAELVGETRSLRSGEELPRGRTWPATYLPLVHLDPGWTCVDTATGAVIDWDPEDMTERMSEERFQATFSERSPSVEAWLSKWVASKTAADRDKPSAEERWARMAARAQTPEGQARQQRETYRHLAQMSPEERAKWGFDKLYPGFETSQGHPDDADR